MKKVLLLVAAAVWSLLFLTLTASAQISGTVFQDFNGNGTLQAAELGMPGIQVKAYNSTDALIASVTTAANGTYNLGAATAGVAVRLEFTPPAGLSCSPGFGATYNGGASATAVQFYAPAASRTVNYGVFDPARYRAAASTNPTIAFTRLHLEDGGVGLASRDVIGNFGYTSTGITAETYYTSPLSTVGSLWAVAYNRSSNRIFTAAVFKRHTRLGTGGTGGIYITDPVANTTSLFATIPNAGTNQHENNLFLDRINNAGTFNTSGTSNPVTAAGTSSLGGMDLSEDNSTLYVTNLNDKLIYQVNAATGVVSATTISIPATGQAGGQDRPWALKIYKGKMYVGVISDASTSQLRTDLRAFVFEYNLCTATWNPTPVVNVSMNYERGTIGNGNGLAFPNDQTRRWNPWVTSWVGNSPAVTQDANAANGGDASGNYPEDKFVYAQPILSDIEFDDANAMILSFSDRTGFMGRREAVDQNGADPGQAAFGSSYTLNGGGNLDLFSGGDIIRIGQCAAGVWTVESNSSVCSVTTSGTLQGQGIGGGEFYWGEHALAYGVSSSGYHRESIQGGLAVSPGTDQILATALDPSFSGFSAAAYTNGVITLNNTTGGSDNGYEIIQSTEGFQKGNSMGDLEFFPDLAPIEIGNRVWNDVNNNGIQDAGEAGISGILLELVDAAGNPVDSDPVTGGVQPTFVTTDAAGNWFLTGSTGADATGINYGVALLPNTSYIVRLATSGAGNDWDPTANAGAGGPRVGGDLVGLNLVVANIIGNGAVDLSDNDAIRVASVPQVSITTGGYGQNNHDIDFGFSSLSALPAEGLILGAALNGSQVTLNWKTISENNTDRFEIERSTNGINFIKVGADVSAAGSSAFEKQYNQKDDIAAVPHSGILYYRVKLYDQNGSYKYSNVTAVRLKSTGIKVWPNPFTELLQVSISVQNAGKVELRISDAAGRVVLSQQQKVSAGMNQLILPGLSRLTKGTYIVEVINLNDNRREVYKLTKD